MTDILNMPDLNKADSYRTWADLRDVLFDLVSYDHSEQDVFLGADKGFQGSWCIFFLNGQFSFKIVKEIFVMEMAILLWREILGMTESPLANQLKTRSLPAFQLIHA